MIVTVGELRAVGVHVHVPRIGAWWADLDFDSDAALVGGVTITITPPGDGTPLLLTGTVIPTRAGTFGLQRRVRVVGGANGWASSLPPKAYHRDNGIPPRLVASEAAAAAGETLAEFTPTGSLGVSFVRESGIASRALDAARGGVPWWVDLSGRTHVAPRPVTPSDVEVLEFDPRERLATLPPDALGRVGVGSRLSNRLDEPQVVTSWELVVSADEARIRAWCGEGERSLLGDSLRALVARYTDGRLHGVYSYRVQAMQGDRVALKATAPGLPDLAAVEEWSGPGIHGQLTPGSEVILAFVDGDRARPVIVGFAAKGKPGAVPAVLELGDATAPVARVGDTVTVYFPPVINGTAVIGGVPTPIILTMVGLTSVGLIQSGNPKVLA